MKASGYMGPKCNIDYVYNEETLNMNFLRNILKSNRAQRLKIAIFVLD